MARSARARKVNTGCRVERRRDANEAGADSVDEPRLVVVVVVVVGIGRSSEPGRGADGVGQAR